MRIKQLSLVAIMSHSLMLLPLTHLHAADDLALPSGDVVAPEIKHTPSTANVPVGEFVDIHATVTDNVGVKEVIVFYRDKINTNEFKRSKMTQELGTDYYSVSLPSVKAPGIEYYIQATDVAGNTILHGHTFSPLSVSTSSDAPSEESEKKIVAIADETVPAPSEGINKWWYVAIGVLAVAALSGDDDPAPGTTGTVIITGPTP